MISLCLSFSPWIRRFSQLIMLAFLINCGQSQSNSQKNSSVERRLPENVDNPIKLNVIQESALDALNYLQVNTDEKNRLYSTFAGIDHLCYPPDTSFHLSQSDFFIAMEQFVTNNCKNISLKTQLDLIKRTSLAQQEYIILHYQNGHSPDRLTGTWIIPELLGRRDVVVVW